MVSVAELLLATSDVVTAVLLTFTVFFYVRSLFIQLFTQRQNVISHITLVFEYQLDVEDSRTWNSSLDTGDRWPLLVATVLSDSSIITQFVSPSRKDDIFHNQYPQTCINIHIILSYTYTCGVTKESDKNRFRNKIRICAFPNTMWEFEVGYLFCRAQTAGHSVIYN
jgi:hypothetical protein